MLDQISQQKPSNYTFQGRSFTGQLLLNLHKAGLRSSPHVALTGGTIYWPRLCTSTHPQDVGQYLHYSMSSFFFDPPELLSSSHTWLTHFHINSNRKPWLACTHVHTQRGRLGARWKVFAIQFPLLSGTFSLLAGSYPRLSKTSRGSAVCAYSALIIWNKARNSPRFWKLSEFLK